MKFRMSVGTAIAFSLAAMLAGPEASGAEDASHGFPTGEIVELGPNAFLVAGQHLDPAKKQPDIANSLFYKVGSSLVVIDTGATADFVPFLDKAAEKLRPFDNVLLINTHLHLDHVANNAWIDTLDVPSAHYISAHEVKDMRDQIGYFAAKFGAASPYLPELPPARDYATGLLSWFGDLRVDSKSLTALESLPLEEIRVGTTIWNGWTFLEGKVAVIQTLGHTNGHVAVFLPDLKLLHLGDETANYYSAYGGTAAWHLMTLERSAQALEEGSVETLVDSHTFEVLKGAAGAGKMAEMVRHALAYNAAAVRILNEHPDGISVVDLATAVDEAPEIADATAGVNTLPLYGVLQILNKLRELGIDAPASPGDPIRFPR